MNIVRVGLSIGVMLAGVAATGDQAMNRTFVTDTTKSPSTRLSPVAVSAVTLQDDFWSPKCEVNHRSTIPHQYAECERTGRIDNFRRAAGRPTLHPSCKLTLDWGIRVKKTDHPVFAGLPETLMFVSQGIPTEDECCYWDDPRKVHGEWLADWENAGGKVVCAEYALDKGKVILLGTGAYFWNLPNGATNNFRAQQEKFTINVLNYLGGASLLYVGAADSPETLSPEAKSAWTWLSSAVTAKYASVRQLVDNPALLEETKVVWWHLVGEPAMPAEMVSESTMNAMRAFLSKGGGLYLTGFAPQYATTLGLEPTPPSTIRQEASDGFRGIFFNDSDVYKWMEAAAFSLATYPDPELDKQLDDLIELIGAAQQPDGYLNTYFMFDKAKDRWTNLNDMHELYLGGHMLQGAVAHHRVTGKDSFLNIGRKWADHVCNRFGPDKKQGCCGHPEIEMGLIELYRETGETRYLDLARFFIEERGRGVLNGSPYLQDHKPIREQITVTGHAVRQNYLVGGVMDIFAETGDTTLLSPVRQQWDDFINTKCYITGGAGARHDGEAYGDAYELPNDTAYAETCAAIAGFMWAWRMLQVDPQSRYADYMERALYNGILSGVSLDGKEYFYVNPLENDGKHRRTTKHFDGCACCPPNVARTLAALPGYLYGVHKGDNSVYLHHFIQSTATIPVGGKAVTIKQETAYPRDGKVTLTVTGVPAEFILFVRIPGWVKKWNMAFQGQPQQMMGEKEAGQYVAIRLEKDTVVELNFEMPVEKCVADPRVKADKDKVAIQRGPMVYCFEQVDNPNVKLQKVSVGDSDFTPVYWADKLGGVMALEGTGKVSGDTVKLTAIPYFAWASREPGPMRVWMRE